MARDERMHARLQRWAQYVVVGDGSGYPSVNVLDVSWTPPSPGLTPTLKVTARSDARETHAAISRLSMRLRNTIVVHYCLRLPLAEQAARLSCNERSVLLRVERAHRELMATLCEASQEQFCNLRSVG